MDGEIISIPEFQGSNMDNHSVVLDVRDLKTYFYTSEGIAKAVDGVSFTLDKGETLAIVGESGSGKSITALSIMGLVPQPAGKIVNGEIYLNNDNILEYPERTMLDLRGDKIAMIFQEPMTSLNPLMTVGSQIAEMVQRHRRVGKKASWERAVSMLEKVQIPVPGKRAKDYPHQLSGGMRQRIMIAMALACNPQILIADEPTTALDVTIQAQILDLMQKLKEDTETAIIMITHDLGVVAEVAERIIVMYAGKIVEEGNVFTIFENPRHPYTKALLKSIPVLGNRAEQGRQPLQEISGIVPNLYTLGAGCSFYPRCDEAKDICKVEEDVEFVDLGDGHRVRCLLCDKKREL